MMKLCRIVIMISCQILFSREFSLIVHKTIVHLIIYGVFDVSEILE